MKRIDLKVLVLLLAVACTPNQEETTSEAVAEEVPTEEVVQLTGNFGDVISEDGALSTVDLLAQLEGSDSVNLKVESEILATCAMKGCWMNVALNEDEHMRVSFKDYAFFVP